MLSEREEYSDQKTGNLLKSLGFKKTRAGKNGASAIIWDENHIIKLQQKYGLQDYEKPSDSSDPSDDTFFNENIRKTEDSEDSEHI